MIHITKPEIEYPDSDGLPMADNTLQFRWIVTIKEGLNYLFRNDPDVFVAGDLLWYPIEGDNTTRLAPDAMVVFGRPKGERGSYRQWVEGGIAPQVVFEVLSPGNRPGEMRLKRQWYESYEVEEYYQYDPDHGRLRGWLATDGTLTEIKRMEGWISPRLGVTFGLEGNDLVLLDPNGNRFRSYLEMGLERDAFGLQRDLERDRAERLTLQYERERYRAERLSEEREQERARAERLSEEREQERARAERLSEEREQERARAERLSEEREQERARAERLAAKLRELGHSE